MPITTTELCKNLREPAYVKRWFDQIGDDAAERIEALEREVAALTTQRDEDRIHCVPTDWQIEIRKWHGIADERTRRAEAAEAQRDELQKRIGYTAVPLVAGGANIDELVAAMRDVCHSITKDRHRGNKMTIEKLLIGIVLASLVAMTIHDCRAAEWDATDKALFTSHVALQVTDALQTNYIRQHQDQFREINSLYGNPPNMGLVIGVKALLVGGSYWLVRDMSSYDRKLVLSVLNVIEIGIVAHNASIGVRVGF